MVQPINSLAQAALRYAAQGFKIFPITPGSKEPLLPGSWTVAATDEPTQVLEWWQEHPDSNIGIMAGEDTVIVDVDRKKGKDGWQEVGGLIDQNTLWAATPNNGFHFYYKTHIDPNERLRSLPGVDVQHRNHYVLAPPSRLILSPWDDPICYQWGGVRDPAPLPAALRERLLEGNTAPAAVDMPEIQAIRQPWPLDRLKASHRLFLTTGQLVDFPSRSEIIPSIAARLYMLGWDDSQVLTQLWLEPQTLTVCLEHRQGDSQRALEYLWAACKKVRHHRVLEVAEVFQAAEDPIDRHRFNELRDEANRLDNADNPRPILQGMATANLDPIDRDLILNILKTKGHTKSSLLTLYRQYEIEARSVAESENGQAIRWVHTSGDGDKPLGTLENLQAMLDYYQAVPRHNLMSHYIDIDVPGRKFLTEERLNCQLTLIRSWAAQTRMPLETIAEQLSMLATRNAYHPMQEFIERESWDGITRVPQYLDTIRMEEEKEHTKGFIVFKWLLSIVASVYGFRNRPPRGVLTFIGEQQQGKTTWLHYLVPKGMYYQGHLLNLDDKDSSTKGLRYLICELGEVGSTYQKSTIEKLKSYIGQREDRYRLPYAREESHWPRRTIFAASTNNEEILHDQTGNTRWWVLPVTGFDLDSMEAWWGQDGDGRELQQLWAEMKVYYDQGYDWDLSAEEAEVLGTEQEDHRELDYFEVMLMEGFYFEDEVPKIHYHRPMTEQQVWNQLGLKPRQGTPDRVRMRDALRRLTGQRRSIQRKIYLASVDGEEKKQKTRRVWFMPDPVKPGVTMQFAPLDVETPGEGDE